MLFWDRDLERRDIDNGCLDVILVFAIAITIFIVYLLSPISDNYTEDEWTGAGSALRDAVKDGWVTPIPPERK